IREKIIDVETTAQTFDYKKLTYPISWNTANYFQTGGFINKKIVPVIIFDLDVREQIETKSEVDLKLFNQILKGELVRQLASSADNEPDKKFFNRDTILGLIAGIGIGLAIGIIIGSLLLGHTTTIPAIIEPIATPTMFY